METTDSWQKVNTVGRKSCAMIISHNCTRVVHHLRASPCEMNCYSSPAGKILKFRITQSYVEEKGLNIRPADSRSRLFPQPILCSNPLISENSGDNCFHLIWLL